ncbi:alpha/beta hydrolase [Sphingomonas floccifaciens]
MPRFAIKRIEAPQEAGAILLPVAAPSDPKTPPESWGLLVGDFPDGSHMEQRIVRNVTAPAIFPVLPKPGTATGAAVVVAPGGAFKSLSIDQEGFDVARKLADRGIAAFVLKYRLNPTPVDDNEHLAAVGRVFAETIARGTRPQLKEPRATEDALAALALVRRDAARFGVDPARVGMIGFSAGAQTVLNAALEGKGAARPAFIGFIYGPMDPVTVPADAPPMFAAIAFDDPLFGRGAMGAVDSWRKAGVRTEFHGYERGDHGFGAGKPGTTSVGVIDAFRLWLATDGWLAPRAR